MDASDVFDARATPAITGVTSDNSSGTNALPRFSTTTVSSRAKIRSSAPPAAHSESPVTRDAGAGRHLRKRVGPPRDPIAPGASSSSENAVFPQPNANPVVADETWAPDFDQPTVSTRRASRIRTRGVPSPDFPTLPRRSARLAAKVARAINPNAEISHNPTVHTPLGGAVQASAVPVLSPLVESPRVATSAAMGNLVPINDSATVRINNARQEVSSCIEGRQHIADFELREAQFHSEAGTTATAASDADDSAFIIPPTPSASTSTISAASYNSSFDQELTNFQQRVSSPVSGTQNRTIGVSSGKKVTVLANDLPPPCNTNANFKKID